MKRMLSVLLLICMLLSLLPGMAFAVDAPAEPAEAVEADAAVPEEIGRAHV